MTVQESECLTEWATPLAFGTAIPKSYQLQLKITLQFITLRARWMAVDSFRLVVLTQNRDLGPSHRLIESLSSLEGIEVSALIVEHRREPFLKRWKKSYRNDGLIGAVDYFLSKVWYKLAAAFTALILKLSRFILQVRKGGRTANDGRPEVCPVVIVDNHNSVETANLIRGEYAADLGLVYGTRILKSSTFTAPRLGTLNIHKRKLPEYRGGGPIGLWEMLDGEDSITVSIHWMTDQVDEGDLVAEKSFPIEARDTLDSISLLADFHGQQLYRQVVQDVRDGTASRTPQSELVATREPQTFRTPADFRLGRLQRQAEANRHSRQTRFAWRIYSMCSLLRWLIFISLSGFSILARRIRYGGKNEPVVILYYHLVSQRRHPMGITAACLHHQLSFLQNYFTFVDMDTAVNALRGGRNSSPLAVLTFDDGYRENMVNARAACDSLDVPACFFVCSQLVGTEQPFAHDSDPSGDFLPFSHAELREFAADPLVQIASHTRSHFDCGSTDDVQILDEEIGDSKPELESLTGQPIRYFSFPWGTADRVNAAAVAAVQRAGYEAAFTAYGGVNYPQPDSRSLLLKRLPTLYGDSWNERLCLLGECLGYSEFVPWGRPQPIASPMIADRP